MMFASNVVDAKDFATTCQNNQHLVQAKGVSHKSSALRVCRWRAQSDDMKEQAFDLQCLGGNATHESTGNVT